jgi:diguanylate cyclase (GGDEF)-like protein
MNNKNFKITTSLFIVVGLIISFSLFSFVKHSLQDIQKSTFNREAENRYNAIYESVNHNEIIMSVLKTYFNSIETVNQDDFADFTINIVDCLPGVVILEYAPKVPSEKLEDFIQSAINIGYKDYYIKDIDNGAIIPAKESDIYYPLYFIVPLKENESALGINIYSDSLSKSEIDLAVDTDSLIITEPTVLLGDSESTFSYAMIQPVEDQFNNEGVLVSLVRFSDLFNRSLSTFDNTINAIIFDTTDSSNPIFIHNYLSDEVEISESDIINETLYLKKNIYFGNRKWTIYFVPTENYISNIDFRYDITILILSLTIILISAYYFYALLNQNKKLEDLVSEKTLELENQAIKDSLTGLYNRRKFFQDIPHFINRYNRRNEVFSLSMIDLDFFKRINDEYGHDVGDFILISFSKYLEEHIRDNDLLVRYGGEEFIILFEATNKINAKEILERALLNLNTKVFTSRGYDIQITFSAGISDISESTDIYKLIKISDERMYYAKEHGRNQIIIE